MKLYRYETLNYESGAKPVLNEYTVQKETPCGFWIFRSFDWFGTPNDPSGKRWVSKTTKKRFAYPTKLEALKGYLHRRTRCGTILKARLYSVHSTIRIADKMIKELEPENSLNIEFIIKSLTVKETPRIFL